MIQFIMSWIHHFKQKLKGIHPQSCQERLELMKKSGAQSEKQYLGRQLGRTFEFEGFKIRSDSCYTGSDAKRTITVYIATDGKFIAWIRTPGSILKTCAVRIIKTDRGLVCLLGNYGPMCLLYRSLRRQLKSKYFPTERETENYPA